MADKADQFQKLIKLATCPNAAPGEARNAALVAVKMIAWDDSIFNHISDTIGNSIKNKATPPTASTRPKYDKFFRTESGLKINLSNIKHTGTIAALVGDVVDVIISLLKIEAKQGKYPIIKVREIAAAASFFGLVGDTKLFEQFIRLYIKEYWIHSLDGIRGRNGGYCYKH